MPDRGREDWLDYGAALRRLRQERGFGLNDLAARAGVSPSYLSEVERGVKRPSTDVLARLAGAFGMAPSELLAYVEASGVVRGRFATFRESPGIQPYDMTEALPPPADEAMARETTSPGDQIATRERSLQAITRMARGLSDDDLRLLVDLARRLLERA